MIHDDTHSGRYIQFTKGIQKISWNIVLVLSQLSTKEFEDGFTLSLF